MRRALLPTSVLLALALSGCGGSAMFDEETGAVTPEAQPEGDPAQEAALECEEPPAAPAAPAEFTQDDLPAPHPGEPATVTATLETTCGDIVVDLFAAEAPQTVASFEFLAGEGYWDDSPCHRLTTSGIYVLQCGDPTGTGRGNPG